MDLSRFGAAPPWSLGVEEELMLVDAETLEPARDGFSRVFGEATERIKPELFESFAEITTPVVESSEEAERELRALRHEVAERAAAHGLALLATGSHPTARGPVPIVAVERYRRIEGGARSGPVPAAGLRAPRSRLRARSRDVPPGVRGRGATAAGSARRLRELAVLGRCAERPALDPLRDPARDADGRNSAGAAELGRLAGGDARRQHAPALGRVAAPGVRDARGARPRPAHLAATDGRVRRRGAAARPGGRRVRTASRSTATSTPFCETPPAATAAARRPSASSSSDRRLPCGRSPR